MEFAPKTWWPTFRDFWRETRSEMKKVTWPGRQEVLSTTLVVLGATLFFAFYLYACDIAFYKIIDFIFIRFGANLG